jgi:transposase
VVWVDEAAFYLLAGVVRTYAPRGHTPVLHVPLTRKHLSVISGITLTGQLLTGMQTHAFEGPDVVRFLQHLARHLHSKLLVIWDGAPIHYNTAITTFLAGTAGQLAVEQLPGYAPDLNPDEGVWDHLKHVELRNVSCHDFQELRMAVGRAIARLRHKPEVIRGFIEHAGY